MRMVEMLPDMWVPLNKNAVDDALATDKRVLARSGEVCSCVKGRWGPCYDCEAKNDIYRAWEMLEHPTRPDTRLRQYINRVWAALRSY